MSFSDNSRPEVPLRFSVPLSALLIFGSACSSSDNTSPGNGNELSDTDVSALARATGAWTFYRNRGDTLLRSVISGHSEARLRTRYNSIAATQLDANGKVRTGAVFPDSSLIVKELIVGDSLHRYTVMLKRNSSNAGAGWLWAEYAPNGAALVPITAKGKACTGCHVTGIDYTRMNDGHP